MNNIKETINYFSNTTILNLGEIIRYNNRRRIKDENVAEHSFYVVAVTLKICKFYNLSDSVTFEALKYAISHDLPEILLGDVIFETKESNPLIKDLIEDAEIEAIKNSDDLKCFYPEYLDFVVGEKNNSLPSLVVKLADTISVVQYSEREIELGNNSKQMLEINKNSKIRVERYIDKIESLLEV